MATDKRLDPPCPIDTALRRPMIEDCGFDVGETKVDPIAGAVRPGRSEEHTSELQSLMRISYAVFCLKKKTMKNTKIKINVRQPNTNKRNQLSQTTTS